MVLGENRGDRVARGALGNRNGNLLASGDFRILTGKKALDKCGVLAYNRNRKSIPVDGLLPLLVVKKT